MDCLAGTTTGHLSWTVTTGALCEPHFNSLPPDLQGGSGADRNYKGQGPWQRRSGASAQALRHCYGGRRTRMLVNRKKNLQRSHWAGVTVRPFGKRLGLTDTTRYDDIHSSPYPIPSNSD